MIYGKEYARILIFAISGAGRWFKHAKGPS